LIGSLLTELENNEIKIFSFDDLKQVLDQEENLVVLVLFMSYFAKNNTEPQKFHLARSYFQKKMKKNENFWHTWFLKEFFEKKESQEKKSSTNNQQSSFITLDGFDYESHLFSVEVLFSFFNNNPTFCPFNFDMKEVAKLSL